MSAPSPEAGSPGHLGELTQIVPFEMIDAVLRETGTVQTRVRDLPSRVVVYLLLAAGYSVIQLPCSSAVSGLAAIVASAC